MCFDNFSELFYRVCEIKKNVVKLNSTELSLFKKQFYNRPFREWQLSLLWEFIWDDKSYDEIFFIFSQKKLIKKEGDVIGKR